MFHKSTFTEMFLPLSEEGRSFSQNVSSLNTASYNKLFVTCFRSSRPEVFLGKGALIYKVIYKISKFYRRTHMPKCDFNKAALQLY